MPNIRVLHLEDDLDRASRVHSYLLQEQIPCATDTCTNSVEFASALERGNVDVILSTWEICDLSGMDALDTALERFPSVPFIFVSPSPGEAGVIEAYNSGATDFILLEDLKRLPPLLRRIAEGGFRKRRREDTDQALRLERAEKERDRQEELLRSIFNLVPVMIAIFDPCLQRFRFNREMTEVLGWTEEDAGPDFMEKVYPDPKYRQEVSHFMQSLEPGWRDLVITAKGGTTIPSSWANIKLSDDRIVGIGIDIRQRKRAEKELRDSQLLLEKKVRERTKELARTIDALQNEIVERQKAELALKEEMQNRMEAVESLRENERLLIQQSRQAAMGEMISNIAHQWRQPLNTLGLLIQGLTLSYDLGGFDRSFLSDTVDRSMHLVQHMSQTIDDFRNFFTPNKEKVSFSLAGSLRNTLSLVEMAFANQGIEIILDVSEDVEVYGYPNELSQAFLNILNNARDAFQERNVEAPQVMISVSSAPGRAVVTITDNAGGISETAMEKIFTPYFTTKGPLGTGLGLFMSKMIVEKNMKGTLTARNTGNGASFTIECRPERS